MFHEIDENTWDRKEIYDAFYGYTYAMTVQLDMTELYAQIKEHGYKFYPTICWLITKTVNSDVDYRFGKSDEHQLYAEKKCKTASVHSHGDQV